MADTFNPESYVPVRSQRPVMPLPVRGSMWGNGMAPAVIWVLLAFSLLPALGALASYLPGVDAIRVDEIATGLFGLGLMAAAAYFAVGLLHRGRTNWALATAGGLAASALALFVMS